MNESTSAVVEGLNPNFTFDNFVVGACNRLAHAAARSVAERASTHPVFLYGATGLGKTHLLHAVAHTLSGQSNLRVVVVSSLRFVEEMVTCIKNDRMDRFREYYRSLDVLLMDDVQFLENKGRTQEELSYTLNELSDQQKQLVFSSDAPPRKIPGLIERLRNRFDAALTADIQPTDLETRAAILAQKAGEMDTTLPDDVLSYLALHAGPSVRQLEGLLLKLIAYCSVADVGISLSAAKRALNGVVETGRPTITIDSIKNAVTDYFSLPKGRLNTKGRDHPTAVARQLGMYLARTFAEASFPKIGRMFGGLHHATVMYAVQKIDKLRQTDPDVKRILEELTERIQRGETDE